MEKPRGDPRGTPLAVHVDPEGRKWFVVRCPYCEADLSRVSVGRTMRAPAGDYCDVFHPLRCPECGHPLIPVPETSPIIPARGPLTS